MANKNPSPTWITPTSKAFMESVNTLKASFVDGKGIPLCLTCAKVGTSECFTPTTATALLALHHIDRLPEELRQRFHETLLGLKSKAIGVYTGRVPGVEDAVWDVNEGESPWITAMAIWALLGTGYKGDRLDEIKRSAIWLAEQQQNGGWGQYPEDPTNLFVTGVVLHALRCVITPSSGINLTQVELRRIKRAREDAIDAIRKSGHRRGSCVYWKLLTKEDPTATLCAIWALHEAQDSSNEDRDLKDKELIEAGIAYLRQKVHDNEARRNHPPVWPFEAVLTRAPVYGPSMTIVSFTPSFVIPLLAMGCDPFDDICLASMQWLQQNRLVSQGGWGHENYGHSNKHALSFTTAYALWILNNWYKYAALHVNTQQKLLRNVKRQRNIFIAILCILSISVFLQFIPFGHLFPALEGWYTDLLQHNDQIQFWWTVISIALAGVAFLKWCDDHFFNQKVFAFAGRIIARLRRRS